MTDTIVAPTVTSAKSIKLDSEEELAIDESYGDELLIGMIDPESI